MNFFGGIKSSKTNIAFFPRFLTESKREPGVLQGYAIGQLSSLAGGPSIHARLKKSDQPALLLMLFAKQKQIITETAKVRKLHFFIKLIIFYIFDSLEDGY